MDLDKHLEHADEAVRTEQEHIDRQKRLVAALEQAGHSSDRAQRNLGILHRTLAAFERHRRILLERMGLYRP